MATGRTTFVSQAVPQFELENPVAPNSEPKRALALRRLYEFRPGVTFDFSRADAGRFVAWMLDQGHKRQNVNQHLWCYSTLWKWATRRGYTEGNPWLEQRLPTKHEPKQVKRSYSDDEIRHILSEAEGLIRDAYRVLLLTGLRVSELAQLRREDVEANWFNVKRSKTKAGQRRVWIHTDLLRVVGPRLGTE